MVCEALCFATNATLRTSCGVAFRLAVCALTRPVFANGVLGLISPATRLRRRSKLWSESASTTGAAPVVRVGVGTGSVRSSACWLGDTKPVDPDQRLVAARLEARWNAALRKVRELEDKLQEFDFGIKSAPIPNKELLLSLAQDLPAVWNLPSTDMRLKQRIVHILIQEIVADVDDEHREVVLLIHWAGGRHSELRVKKYDIGRHRWCTSIEAIEVIRKMATRFSDQQIATTLNRLRLQTGTGNTWNDKTVRSARYNHHLPIFGPSDYKEQHQ